MKNFAVWYMKPDFFRDGTMGVEWLRERNQLPDVKNLAATHVFLRYCGAENVEHVFGKMQGEVWSPNGEARDRIEALGLRHTSMSVGDIAVDVESGEVYLCDRFGFETLAEAV